MTRLIMKDGGWFNVANANRIHQLWQNYIELEIPDSVEHIELASGGDVYVCLSEIQSITIQTNEQLENVWREEKEMEKLRDAILNEEVWE